MKNVNTLLFIICYTTTLNKVNTEYIRRTEQYGFCNIRDIIDKPIFVDKSSMLPTLLNSSGILYVTAPTGFGKTCILNMIKRFFEIETSSQGSPITKANFLTDPINDTINYRLFVRNNLKVTKNKEYMAENFGKFPVISLNFKPSNRIKSYKNALQHLSDVISNAYLDHSYLPDSFVLKREDKDECRKILAGKEYGNSEKKDLVDKIASLSTFLYKQFNRECVLLVDDFSSIISSSWYDLKTSELASIVNLCWELFDKIIKQPFKLIFFTGTLYLKPTSKILLEKIRPYVHLLDDKEHNFDRYYGLIDFEKEELIKNKKLLLEDDKMLSSWYNGYAYKSKFQRVHNIKSVAAFLLYGQIYRSYWPETDLSKAVQDAFQYSIFRLAFERLITGDKIINKVCGAMNAANLSVLEIMRENPRILTKDHVQDFLCILNAYGYVTKAYENLPPRFGIYLRAPNRELNKELKFLHKNLIRQSWTTDLEIMDECVSLLGNLSFTTIETNLNNLKTFSNRLNEIFQLLVNLENFEMDKGVFRSILLHIIQKTKYFCKMEYYLNFNMYIDLVLYKGNRCIMFNINYGGGKIINRLQNLIDNKFQDIFRNKNIFRFDVKKYLLIDLRIEDDGRTKMNVLINTDDIKSVKKF